MSAEWDGTQNPQQPGAPGGQMAAQDMGGQQVPDASAFTPEQWEAYQNAFTQATQAQQLYAQAQQYYMQAQQAGQEEQAAQAYQQATQAQQMYAHAHQTYLAILQQVQQGAGAQDPNAAYQQQQMQAQQMQQAGYTPEQQQAMAYQQQMQAQQMQQAGYSQEQLQAMQAQQMQQAGYTPEQQQAMAYQQQMQAQQMQQAGYSQDQLQAMAYQQQMAQQQGYSPSGSYAQAGYSPSGAYAQAGYSPSGAYAQAGDPLTASADPFAAAGDMASADPYEGMTSWGTDDAELYGSSGSIWWWVIGILVFASAGGAYYVATQPPPKVKTVDPPNQGPKMTKAQQEALKRKMLGLDKEETTRYLRLLPFSLENQPWQDVAVAGRGECRSVYVIDNKKFYVTEGEVPKKSKDYLNRPTPDPMAMNSLALPVQKPTSFELLQGTSSSFLVERYKIGHQPWLLLYPLVGNPLKAPNRPKKKKGADDAPTCGSSQLPGYILSKDLILIGYGSCATAASVLGVVPKTCIERVRVARGAPLTFFQTGKKAFPPRGNLIVGSALVGLSKRAKARSVASLYERLRKSTTLTPENSGRRWVSVNRENGEVWTVDARGRHRTLGARLPNSAKTAIRAHLAKGTLRVVFPDKLVKYRLRGRKVTTLNTFSFGKNVIVHQATWGQDGNILLLRTKQHKIYQFSENP